MADVLLGVGAAVAKLACKIWLKDHAIAADTGVDLIDIVKSKVAGELDRRHARRFFEDLEVPVAAKLQVLRRHEFVGMPDNEWTAATLAVRDTLNEARLTDADIFAQDLDPLYLRRHIASAGRAATRDLSANGTALYERLLTECCAYIVELVTALPGFHAGAFTEILQRQTIILQRIAQLLDRIPNRDEMAGNPSAEIDFITIYRQQVANQLDRLELFGVSVAESIRSYPLSKAYISIAMSAESLVARRHAIDSFAGMRQPVLESVSGTLRIDDALLVTKRLFLRGEAGSGKTTLLQWLAVRAAQRDFPENMASWNDTVPFLIRLRHFVGRTLPPPERFLGYVGQHIADEMPSGWVHRLLRQGQALILVDGVDELPEGERRSAKAWLRDLINVYPHSSYVVTSRPAAARDDWLELEGFDAAEVQPMSWPDVKAFVEHWHASIRDAATDEDKRTYLVSCEKSLLEKLYARRHLRQLAANPLLCALICALHLDRRMQIPEERMELYAVALDMLLERRDVERQISGTRLRLTKTDKTLLLEDLAYWLIRNGWSDVPKFRAIEHLDRRLSSMPRVEVDSSAVLSHLLERSALLREPVVDRIDFVHRTFEEYLAAHAAVDGDHIGELVRNAHDDQWREVVVLAAGHAQQRQREELLQGLLERAATERENQQLLQVLAIACLETAPRLDPLLHAKIESVADSLLPPKAIRDAEALARSGEFLLDLLAERPIRSDRQAAATIRAAGLIGSDAALRLISKCGTFRGPKTFDEVMRAWWRFDIDEYAIALSDSPHLQTLRVDDPTLLDALCHLKRLRSLTVDLPRGYGDIGFIADVPSLKYLYIRDPALVDLSPIGEHQELHRLELRDTGRLYLAPLEKAVQLEELDLSYSRVIDPHTLVSLRQLRKIQFYDSAPKKELPHILPPVKLHRFGLWQAQEIRGLEELLPMPQLDELDFLLLSNCDHLVSLSGIERWASSMTGLYLHAHKIVDTDQLGRLGRLDFLNLAFTPVADMAFLYNLTNLRILHLGGVGPLPDLSPIRDLSNLNRLYLWGDEDPDLSPLAGARNLVISVRRGRKIHGAKLLGKGSRIIRMR